MKPNATRRDAVSLLAESKASNTRVACPVCLESFKAKNLVLHFDREHAERAPDPAPPLAADQAPETEAPREPRSEREQMLELARTHPPGEAISCPGCGQAVKAKNLAKHYDKQHGNAAEAKQAQAQTHEAIVATTAAQPAASPLPEVVSCPELIEIAQPGLYRGNVFRMLGLDVLATAEDVRRQKRRAEMQSKLGMGAVDGPLRALSLDPPATSEESQAAVQRLNDPVGRLLDELFWFWPLDGAPKQDPALLALDAGDLPQVQATWHKAKGSGAAGAVATHNLAVLEHLTALELEAQRRADGELSTPDRRRLEQAWSSSYTHWQEVIASEDIWRKVKDRVRELDDPRLTTGLVRRIRGALLQALLGIHAQLALEAAQAGDTALAAGHTATIREVAGSTGLDALVLRDAVQPVRQRLQAVTERARVDWKSDPQLGAQAATELKAEALPLLAVVDALLAPSDASRQGMHDRVADAMLEGQVAYVRKTEDYATSVTVLEEALSVAEGEALCAKLPDQIRILREQEQGGNHWCAPGYWDLPAEELEALEAIRVHAINDDFDEAITQLIARDAHFGSVQARRCLAYSLGMRSVRKVNHAQDAFDPMTSLRRKAFERLAELGETRLSLLIMQVQMLRSGSANQFSSKPTCYACGSTYYQSWSTFEFKNVLMLFCTSCSEADDVEFNQSRSTLQSEVREGYQYILLASEIDSDDVGVQRNLKTLRELAGNLDVEKPKTQALRGRLGLPKSKKAKRAKGQSAKQSSSGARQAEASTQGTTPAALAGTGALAAAAGGSGSIPGAVWAGALMAATVFLVDYVVEGNQLIARWLRIETVMPGQQALLLLAASTLAAALIGGLLGWFVHRIVDNHESPTPGPAALLLGGVFGGWVAGVLEALPQPHPETGLSWLPDRMLHTVRSWTGAPLPLTELTTSLWTHGSSALCVLTGALLGYAIARFFSECNRLHFNSRPVVGAVIGAVLGAALLAALHKLPLADGAMAIERVVHTLTGWGQQAFGPLPAGPLFGQPVGGLYPYLAAWFVSALLGALIGALLASVSVTLSREEV